MLESHFRSVLDLHRGTSQNLGRRTGCHCASRSQFSLTSYLGTGNRTVGFHDVTNQSSRGQTFYNSFITNLLIVFQKEQHGRYDPGRPARGSRHDLTSCRILFGNCQSGSKYHSHMAQGTCRLLGPHVVGTSLACQPQVTG